MALMSKAAIVTGAAQGIGKAIAARLVKDGMRVAIVDINQEAAVAAAEELAGQYGADTMAVQCDVSQEEQVNTAVQKVLERFGTVDVLVNNAGILSLKKPFVEMCIRDSRNASASVPSLPRLRNLINGFGSGTKRTPTGSTTNTRSPRLLSQELAVIYGLETYGPDQMCIRDRGETAGKPWSCILDAP